MTMVDDGVAGPVHPAGAHEPSKHRAPGVVPVPCVARPGTGLAHLDGRCECFFGGPPPVYLFGAQRALTRG